VLALAFAPITFHMIKLHTGATGNEGAGVRDQAKRVQPTQVPVADAT